MKWIKRVVVSIICISIFILGSFTIYSHVRMPIENIALMKTSGLSLEEKKAVDGDEHTFFKISGGEMLTIDLEDDYYLESISVTTGDPFNTLQFQLDDDLEKYEITNGKKGENKRVFDFSPTTRKIKIMSPSDEKQIELSEVSVTTTASIGPQREKNEVADLRVGSFNLAAGKKPVLSYLNGQIKREQIDLIGFQEVDHYMFRNHYDMLEKVTNGLYEDTYFSKSMNVLWGEYGLATASSELIGVREKHDLPVEGKNEKRIFQRTLHLINGKEVAFYNTHLSFESKEMRTKQLAILKEELLNDSAEYKILVGDFNTDDSIDEYAPFMSDFKLVNGNNNQWFDTFSTIDTQMNNYAIDNIIVSKNIEIIDVEVIELKNSDHYLLYADIKLT